MPGLSATPRKSSGRSFPILSRSIAANSSAPLAGCQSQPAALRMP
jgi:hypothetical protein